MNDEKKPSLPTLSDDEIVTAGVDRRSFLTKVGIGSAVVATAVLAPACSKSDDCDQGGDADPCSTDTD